MQLQLTNKVIIVTGGARGIGRAIVKLLADEGAIPVIVGRHASENQALVDELKEAGKAAGQVTIELAAVDQLESVVANIIQQFGKIDGLVNNAGYNDGVGLEKGNYAAFMESLHNNLVHYYMMAHYCLPWLKKINRGGYCKYCFQNCRNRAGRYFCLCRCQWGKKCLNP